MEGQLLTDKEHRQSENQRGEEDEAGTDASARLRGLEVDLEGDGQDAGGGGEGSAVAQKPSDMRHNELGGVPYQWCVGSEGQGERAEECSHSQGPGRSGQPSPEDPVAGCGREETRHAEK